MKPEPTDLTRVTATCNACSSVWVSSLPFEPFTCPACESTVREYLAVCDESGVLKEEVSMCCSRAVKRDDRGCVCTKCKEVCRTILVDHRKRADLKLVVDNTKGK